MEARRSFGGFFAVLVLSSLVGSARLACASCDFPAIFNFGDLNSDTGGLSAVFGQAPPPHGETHFRRPVGRYSDGHLVVDFIGTDLDASLVTFYFLLCSKLGCFLDGQTFFKKSNVHIYCSKKNKKTSRDIGSPRDIIE